MNVFTRIREGVVVIDLEGKINIGKGDIALRDAFDAAVEQGARKILFNFEKVRSMDSSGMAELVDLGEGTVSLTNLPSNVGEILRMTQIITVFDFYENEDEAIEAMR
jgi:anti-sigma B factor antagonist